METALDTHSTPGIRAFIAEDSAAISERLIALLTEGGEIAVVGEAITADTAIERILSLRPDIVTLDIHLRDSSGLRVIHEVRRLAPEIQFIVLTDHPDPIYRRAFAQEGASCFLDKNLEFSRVKEMIISACADSRRPSGHSNARH